MDKVIRWQNCFWKILAFFKLDTSHSFCDSKRSGRGVGIITRNTCGNLTRQQISFPLAFFLLFQFFYFYFYFLGIKNLKNCSMYPRN